MRPPLPDALTRSSNGPSPSINSVGRSRTLRAVDMVSDDQVVLPCLRHSTSKF